MDIDVHHGPDGEQYVTRKHAALLTGVKASTIGTWETRGYLARVPGTPPRKPLYRMGDVIDAEYQARTAALRTSGSTTRTVRHFSDEQAA